MQDILDNFGENISNQCEDWELKAYVGDKSDHYLSKWKNRNEQFFLSFNFAAFFLVAFWLIHRRMYLYALAYALVSVVETHFTYFVFQGLPEYMLYINFGMHLIYALFIGFIGNYLYLKNAEENIKSKIEKL